MRYLRYSEATCSQCNAAPIVMNDYLDDQEYWCRFHAQRELDRLEISLAAVSDPAWRGDEGAWYNSGPWKYNSVPVVDRERYKNDFREEHRLRRVEEYTEYVRDLRALLSQRKD